MCNTVFRLLSDIRGLSEEKIMKKKSLSVSSESDVHFIVCNLVQASVNRYVFAACVGDAVGCTTLFHAISVFFYRIESDDSLAVVDHIFVSVIQSLDDFLIVIVVSEFGTKVDYISHLYHLIIFVLAETSSCLPFLFLSMEGNI